MLFSIDYLFKILCNSCVLFLSCLYWCVQSKRRCPLNSMLPKLIWNRWYPDFFCLDFISGINFANFLEIFFWSFDLVKLKTNWIVIVFLVGVVNDSYLVCSIVYFHLFKVHNLGIKFFRDSELLPLALLVCIIQNRFLPIFFFKSQCEHLIWSRCKRPHEMNE